MQNTLSQRLRACRKAVGMTRWKVAVYCDITEKAYRNYERMTREPRLEILVRIADCFHVSPDYPTGRTEDRTVRRRVGC